MVDDPSGFTAVAGACREHPGVRLAVVFGSRARGDTTAASDWDVGILAGADLDHERLLADLVRALGTERLDLVDLAGAGALLRFRAARDGVAVFERTPDAFARFWLEAVDFWCDAGPLIRAGYEAVLTDLVRYHAASHVAPAPEAVRGHAMPLMWSRRSGGRREAPPRGGS